MRFWIPRAIACGLLAVAATSIAGCDDTSGPESADWRLVWQDDFQGPAGQLPDPANWTFDIGTDWGNAQLEYDTDRPENASLDGNGHLAITARQEAWLGQPYTSARIVTRGLREQAGGRFEARIRMPTGKGIWPAFWLLGANIDEVGWPASGEIDIAEFRGQEPSRIWVSLHGPDYSGSQAVTRAYDIPRDRFDTDFHVFALEWRERSIRWFVDDSLVRDVAREDLPGPWVFDHPFYVILNVAVGGNWVGPVGPDTTFPQTMLVDWVKVYEEAP